MVTKPDEPMERSGTTKASGDGRSLEKYVAKPSQIDDELF